jgi:hypothetical protein
VVVAVQVVVVLQLLVQVVVKLDVLALGIIYSYIRSFVGYDLNLNKVLGEGRKVVGRWILCKKEVFEEQ